eukprot:16448082-Heterocapsa_arctica.AAC.1
MPLSSSISPSEPWSMTVEILILARPPIPRVRATGPLGAGSGGNSGPAAGAATSSSSNPNRCRAAMMRREKRVRSI